MAVGDTSVVEPAAPVTPSMHDAITDAVKSLELDSSLEPEVVATPEPEITPELKVDPEPQPGPEVVAVEPEPEPIKDVMPGEPAPVIGEPEPEVKVEPKELKAPASWKPEMREKWASIDDDVKGEILRREDDMYQGIREFGSDAKYGRELASVIQPYEATMKSIGATAHQVVGELLSADHRLRYGSPADRASKLVEIMEFYKVDLDAVNDVLAKAETSGATSETIPSAVAQRLDHLERQVAGHAANQDAATTTDATAALETFLEDGKKEFYSDVRLDMADIIERGGVATIEEAYERATWAHPEVRKVLLARQADEVSQSSSQRAVDSRRASGSIAGGPNGTLHGSGVDPKDLRATIADAFGTAGGRV